MNKKDVVYERYYFSNRRLRGECPYINGIKNGTWKQWYQNGIIEHEFNYANGEFHGLCSQWNEDGVRYWIDTNKIGFEHGISIAFFYGKKKF